METGCRNRIEDYLAISTAWVEGVAFDLKSFAPGVGTNIGCKPAVSEKIRLYAES